MFFLSFLSFSKLQGRGGRDMGVKWQLRNKSKCSKASETKRSTENQNKRALRVREHAHGQVMKALLV